MNDTYYYHGLTRDPDEPFHGYQRYTLAGKFRRIYRGKRTLDLSAALCSEQDQFCKATGRMIAERRLDAGKKIFTLFAVPFDKEYSEAKNFSMVMVGFQSLLAQVSNLKELFKMKEYGS
jgi:hypothetical protein